MNTYAQEILKQEQAVFDAARTDISKDGVLMYAGNLLKRAAMLYANVPALIYQDSTMTYKELYHHACRLSKTLKERGVKPRDRVLIFIENSPLFYIAYYGAWQIGAVVAPLNTFLKETELSHIIQDAAPVCILTSSEYVPLLERVKNVSLPPILTESEIQPSQTADAMCVLDQTIELEREEMAALLYTSGTTGVPKGVMLSSKNIMTSLLQGFARLHIGEGQRVFGVLPLFHAFAQGACVWGAFFKGATVILVPKIERRYILAALKHRPTVFLGVPALYGLMCLMKNAPLDSVEYFVSGGDALSDKIRAYFALLYRRHICNGYGLTETSPTLAVTMEDEIMPTSTIGLPLVGVDCSIRDEQGNEVAHGDIGELWVKGDNIMLGYYNAPEATSKVLQNGWFNTGDLVYVDEKGRLVISGRTKDLISNKGFKIYPQEIENVLLSHPNVFQVGVVGKHDEQQGEVPVAFVQLRKDEDDIVNVLRKLCMDHLASYKVPKMFICSTETLPATATGKIDKKILRKRLAEMHD